MKRILKFAAMTLCIITLNSGLYAENYPIFHGNLSEVSYRVVKETPEVIIVEINGVTYQIIKNK